MTNIIYLFNTVNSFIILGFNFFNTMGLLRFGLQVAKQ